MQYNCFHIKNFKGIEGPLDVNLTEGNKSLPYVLVGNNESGKTTILTAIETIYRAIISEKLELKKLNEIMPKQVYFTDDIVLGATVFFEQADIEYVQQQMEEGKASKKRRESFANLLARLETDKTIKITYVYSFASNRLESQEILIDERSNSEFLDLVIEILRKRLPHILYREDFIFEVPKKIRFVKTQAEETNKVDSLLLSEENVVWQDIFNDILIGSSKKNSSANAKVSFQKDVIDWDSSTGNDADKQRITAMNDYLNHTIRPAWQDITGSNSTVFDRFNIKLDEQANNIIDYTIEVEAKAKNFALNERSKGCQWFFCFKILTEIIANRYTNGIIFLLDEPASNLHIHPQEKILEALIALSAKPGVNVIYSTHSPYLIDANSSVGNIFIVTNDAGDHEDANIRCTDITNIDLSNDAVHYALEPVRDSLLLTSMKNCGAQSLKVRVKELFVKIKNTPNKLETIEAICGISAFGLALFK